MQKRAKIAALAAVAFTAVIAADAKDSIRITNQFPPSHFISKGIQLFAQKVSEYSNGTLTVNVFDSAQLFKDTEVVEAVQDGLIEMALVPVNKWSGMIPATDIFEVPFVFSELDSPKKFLDSGASELLDEAFQKKGAKVVFWVDYGPVQFFNNVRPLKTPVDFKGLKLRSFSKLSADTVSALGASPTVLTSSEMYMALQRGTVDGATTGVPAAVSRKLQEVQKYLSMDNYSTAQFVVQANAKWWKKLSAAKKDVYLKAGADAAAAIRESIAAAEKAALDEVKKQGVEVYYPTDNDRKAFLAATAGVAKSYAKEAGPLGQKLLDLAAKMK